MKKSNIFRLTVILLVVFAYTGVKSQVTNFGNDATKGWPAHTTINEYISGAGNKVTVGHTMPYWVWPSAAYNPNFDYTAIVPYATVANITNNVTSTFAWSVTTAGTHATVTPSAGNRNYVTIKWDALDVNTTQTISVTETPASGGCTGSAVTFDVSLIAAPTAVITTTGTPKYGLTNIIQEGCGDQTTTIPLTGLNIAEVTPYAFYINYSSYNVDGLDATGKVPNSGGNLDKTGLTDLADKLVKGADNTNAATSTSNPVITAVTGAATGNMIASTAFTVQNNKITVYEFDLAGFNAKVSRTSDYLDKAMTAAKVSDYANYNIYGTAGKYYIVALPTPVTGPIYHIANTWGL